jgi:hypothetical protein
LTFPFEQQLVGDVDHAVVHAPQCGRPEGRHQDAMGRAPARLSGLGGEQPVPAEVAHAAQRPVQLLVEA